MPFRKFQRDLHRDGSTELRFEFGVEEPQKHAIFLKRAHHNDPIQLIVLLKLPALSQHHASRSEACKHPY